MQRGTFAIRQQVIGKAPLPQLLELSVFRSQRASGPASDAKRQLHVARLDGDTLCMDGAQDAVLKEGHQVRLARLLQRLDSIHAKAHIHHVPVSQLTDETLERQLGNQQLRRPLEAADVAESRRAWPITTSRRRRGGRRRGASRGRPACPAWTRRRSRLLATCGLLDPRHGGGTDGDVQGEVVDGRVEGDGGREVSRREGLTGVVV